MDANPAVLVVHACEYLYLVLYLIQDCVARAARRISPTSYPDSFKALDEHVRPRWPMAGEPLYRWSGQASLGPLAHVPLITAPQ